MEGFWLWLMFIPSAAISAWAMLFVGSWEVQVFAVCLVLVGALIIFLLNYLRASQPQWFKGVDGVLHFDPSAQSETRADA